MTYLARWFTVWFLSYSLLRSTTSQYTVLLTQNDTWHKIGTLTRVQMVNFLLEFVQCHFAEEIFIQCRFEVRISFYPFILKKSRSSYAPQNLGVTVKLVSVADALSGGRTGAQFCDTLRRKAGFVSNVSRNAIYYCGDPRSKRANLSDNGTKRQARRLVTMN